MHFTSNFPILQPIYNTGFIFMFGPLPAWALGGPTPWIIKVNLFGSIFCEVPNNPKDLSEKAIFHCQII